MTIIEPNFLCEGVKGESLPNDRSVMWGRLVRECGGGLLVNLEVFTCCDAEAVLQGQTKGSRGFRNLIPGGIGEGRYIWRIGTL